jgi:CBS domain-containing protein
MMLSESYLFVLIMNSWLFVPFGSKPSNIAAYATACHFADPASPHHKRADRKGGAVQQRPQHPSFTQGQSIHSIREAVMVTVDQLMAKSLVHMEADMSA